MPANNSLSTTGVANNIYDGIEFNMPRVEEPQIPNNTVSITEFGAVGDGLTKNTKPLKKPLQRRRQKAGVK